MNCYYCNTTLNARNKSLEHVLPNAIGGKLKSFRLLCRTCNLLLGKTVDAALTTDLYHLCSFFDIKRDRPPKPDSRNGIPITENEPADDTTIDFNIGGTDSLKAVGKIAINAYLCWGGSRDNISQGLSFVKGEIANDQIVHYHYAPAPIEWDDEEVSHIIHMVGDSESKALYAYVVFFSSLGFIVNLSDDYTGESFNRTYRFDILQNKLIEKPIAVNYPGRTRYTGEMNANTDALSAHYTNTVETYLSRALNIAGKEHIEAPL